MLIVTSVHAKGAPEILHMLHPFLSESSSRVLLKRRPPRPTSVCLKNQIIVHARQIVSQCLFILLIAKLVVGVGGGGVINWSAMQKNVCYI